jgi:hypothetical protein
LPYNQPLLSEAANRRRTDNTIAKRKRTKGPEKFEDTTGINRKRTDNKITKRKRTKGQEKFEDTKE